VLEEVREAGLARLHFVARTGLHRDLDRHDVGEAGLHDYDLQAIGERALGVRERHDIAGGSSAGGAGRRRCFRRLR
jgi:hypothetical protein